MINNEWLDCGYFRPPQFNLSFSTLPPTPLLLPLSAWWIHGIKVICWPCSRVSIEEFILWKKTPVDKLKHFCGEPLWLPLLGWLRSKAFHQLPWTIHRRASPAPRSIRRNDCIDKRHSSRQFAVPLAHSSPHIFHRLKKNNTLYKIRRRKCRD